MNLGIYIVTGTEESIRQVVEQSTKEKDSSSSGSINGGLIGGIVAAVVFVIIIGAVIVVFIVKRWKGVYILLYIHLTFIKGIYFNSELAFLFDIPHQLSYIHFAISQAKIINDALIDI